MQGMGEPMGERTTHSVVYIVSRGMYGGVSDGIIDSMCLGSRMTFGLIDNNTNIND